jgi:hypothetical protein
MSELMANQETMEKFIGNKISCLKVRKLVYRPKPNGISVYFNIPRKIDINSLELTEE